MSWLRQDGQQVDKTSLRLWKNKGFKEERMIKVGCYAIGTSTTLESNKSQLEN